MPNDLSPARQEAFDLLAFLDGACFGWGVFEDRFGRLKKKFEITAHGVWSGDTVVLSETFTYGDGTSEERVWRLTPTSDGGFDGRCPDCRGLARGMNVGDHTTLDYTFLLKSGRGTIPLQFADRFYPVGQLGVVNRTRVSKWGAKVGEVSAVFVKDAARVQTSADAISSLAIARMLEGA